ncbi:hypothetical protein ACJJH9_04100 [Microbulbifer sp. DLAB2-AF]|uniref:hypothetical protein n=1 Tax=Microbulbifer sp. DLAB2-AF TaxID=3243395 RepID=UPI00403A4507
MFFDTGKEREIDRIFDAHKTVVESGINSAISACGGKKTLDREIDLSRKEDLYRFFSYLHNVINDVIEWVQAVKNHLNKELRYHKESDIYEMALIASNTNFDLKEETNLDYSHEKGKATVEDLLKSKVSENIPQATIDALCEKYGIQDPPKD